MSKHIKINKTCAFLLTDYFDRKYFSSIEVDEGYLVITDEKAYFTDARYTLEVDEKLVKSDIKSIGYKDLSQIKEYLVDKGVKTVYVNFEKTTVSFYNQLKKLGFKVRDGKDRIESQIAVKEKHEIDAIKKACQITQNSFYKAIDSLKNGITEREVKEIIEENYIKQGALVSFETIVAFGENSAVPHHKIGDRKLTDGDVVLIDMGCKYNGYASDLTRTVCYKTASREFIDCYEKVLSANEKAISQIVCGMEYKDIDAISRNHLKEFGLDGYFTHSLGHGLGLEIHEYPRLSPKGKGKIKNNVVFTIEPGVYINGKFGIRIEDTVILKKGKVQRLFTDDKGLLIIK